MTAKIENEAATVSERELFEKWAREWRFPVDSRGGFNDTYGMAAWAAWEGRAMLAASPGAASPAPQMQKSDQVHLTRNDGSRATVSQAEAEEFGRMVKRAAGKLIARHRQACFAFATCELKDHDSAAKELQDATEALDAALGNRTPARQEERQSEKEVGAAPLPVQGQDTDVEIEIHCNGNFAAGAAGPRDRAWNEALHYAAQYAQDGPITFYEVTRREVTAPKGQQ